jgi:hypothetical protein
MKVPLVGAELLQSDIQIDMTKLIVAFRNFANAPKHGTQYSYIQGVPGGKDLTSGECSLGQTIPI